MEHLGDRHHEVFIVVYDEHARGSMFSPFHGSPRMALGVASFKRRRVYPPDGDQATFEDVPAVRASVVGRAFSGLGAAARCFLISPTSSSIPNGFQRTAAAPSSKPMFGHPVTRIAGTAAADGISAFNRRKLAPSMSRRTKSRMTRSGLLASSNRSPSPPSETHTQEYPSNVSSSDNARHRSSSSSMISKDCTTGLPPQARSANPRHCSDALGARPLHCQCVVSVKSPGCLGHGIWNRLGPRKRILGDEPPHVEAAAGAARTVLVSASRSG